MDQGRRAASIGKLHYRDAGDPNGFDPEIAPMHIMDGVGMLSPSAAIRCPSRASSPTSW